MGPDLDELGVSDSLSFHDVWSLDEPELLAFIPRPVLALVIVFPTPADYEARLAEEDTAAPTDSGDEGDVLWFKQTINNACGLYGILHAVANGGARDFINPGSHLSRLLEKCTALSSSDRASLLENDNELESTYMAVAVLGDTKAPENPEDEVDFHYVCFVKSYRNDKLYMMDGDRNGPSNKGQLPTADLLSEQGTEVIRQFIQQHDNGGHFMHIWSAITEF
ncbi:hypothetical protein DL768_001801 [Monosporascus sp. mg162]|nr:hypothetical protein DL768_001801 [Monosporascus sp. mg162]